MGRHQLRYQCSHLDGQDKAPKMEIYLPGDEKTWYISKGRYFLPSYVLNNPLAPK